MTQLYLIRHGIAAEPTDYATDEERPLTEVGQKKTRKVAERLKQLDLKFDILLSSPLVRARQTADILQEVGLCGDVEIFTPLVPDGAIQEWMAWWQTWKAERGHDGKIALVGHQPDLGNWAEILVWGEVREKLVVKKAGVIGVELPDTASPVGRSLLFWLAPPRLLL
ncbi:MAG: phosphohistidine phosphatase SixA [Cyanobacteria bacterium SID2]|nr:phosphohistidine phosphatase SixA [Cyanobacteria bacterium SID2]MBP0005218.1 phosphohistidine phosphatase SixA [Cyanobacteria bacterium SBC]